MSKNDLAPSYGARFFVSAKGTKRFELETKFWSWCRYIYILCLYIWAFNPIRPDLPSLNPGDHAPRPPLPTSRLGRRLLRRVQWNPFHLSKWIIQNWKRHEARLSDQWFSSKALLHLPCQTQKFPKWLVLPITSEMCRKSSDSLSPPKNANKSRHYSWSNIPNWRLPREPRNSPTWLGRQSWIISHFIGYCIIECKIRVIYNHI